MQADALAGSTVFLVHPRSRKISLVTGQDRQIERNFDLRIFRVNSTMKQCPQRRTLSDVTDPLKQRNRVIRRVIILGSILIS